MTHAQHCAAYVSGSVSFSIVALADKSERDTAGMLRNAADPLRAQVRGVLVQHVVQHDCQRILYQVQHRANLRAPQRF